MKKTKAIAGIVTALLILSAVPGSAARAEEPPELPEEPPAAAEEPVVNVAIPVTVDITIDPLEIGDRGQVWSDAYEIRNHGDTDVILTFTDFEVIFANNTDFEALKAPFDGASESDLKAIYMLLHFGRADIPPAVMTDANTGPVSIPLAAAGEGVPDEDTALSLSFSGDVNPYPGKEWNTGDVKIRLTYRLEAVHVPEEEIIREAEVLPEDEIPEDEEEDTLPPEEEPDRPPAETETPPQGGAEEPDPEQNPDQSTSGSAIVSPGGALSS